MVWRNIPPDERPNWNRLNEGQKRYAWEQYNLALVRRGLPINHPIPDPEEDDVEEPQAGTSTEQRGDQDIEEGGVSDTAPEERDGRHDDAMAPPQPMDTSDAGPSRAVGKGSKRKKTTDSGVAEGDFALPGTGQGQGDGGGIGESNSRIVGLPNPSTSIHSNIRYYRKVHKFLTWGIAYQVLESTVSSVLYRNICTPFANIPWDRSYLYLTPAEFEALPEGAYVTSVRCEVRARNVRVAFPTNSSSTDLATLNQNKDVCYAVGLNKKLNTVNVQYTAFQDTQPMIPTSYEVDNMSKHQDLYKDLYGRDWTDPTLTVPRHQMGIPTPLPCYAMIPYYKRSPESGYPCLQAHYKEMDADEASGSVFCKVEYKPICGIIKDQLDPITYTYPKLAAKSNVTIPRQGLKFKNQYTSLSLSEDDAQRVIGLTDTDGATETLRGRAPAVTSLIEKSQWIRHGPNGMVGMGTQPSLHIAVQPTPALDTKSLGGESNGSFTDTQGNWEIICEMEVSTAFPTPYPLYNGPHGTEDCIYFKNTAGPNEFVSLYGGFLRA